MQTQPGSAPSISPYPLRVEGRLGQPSRWLWLVKWFLVLPHFLLLVVLWPAFILSSATSFVVLFFGGGYPRRLFDFNLGVMRWSWRVVFYAYAANGTDLYPPFTLADVDDYPARLGIAYAEDQRRGLPLIGWWLAGLPQYLVVAILAGGGVIGSVAWLGGVGLGGLIGLLVLVAAVMLAVRGVYPRPIFDLVLGLDRWVLRVLAYAAVMTSEYPPFRLDGGEHDLGGAFVTRPAAGSPTERAPRATWSTRRIVATALACLTGLAGVAAIVAGGSAIVLDQTQRDAGGSLMSAPAAYSTGTYALSSQSYGAGVLGDHLIADDLLGPIQVKAKSGGRVFVGIAPAAAVDHYLAGVGEAEVDGIPGGGNLTTHQGGAPAAPPGSEHFWAASASGPGPQTVDWSVRPGSWRLVVMNADGSDGVSAALGVGAAAPHLLAIGAGTLGLGLLLLGLVGGVLLYLARRSGRA